MANNAVSTQLAIMVRKPTMVWPGLDRMDLKRKHISGDGNCLFASLADQLYGDSTKHLEIRASIIHYMRLERQQFDQVALKDDIQQKRATRQTTSAIRNTTSDDPFEEYLALMSKSGTYGGEPELVAFVQGFDQDVTVHLPCEPGYPDSIPYTNGERVPGADIKPTLHLCYDNKYANAHYDSARKTSLTTDNSRGVSRTRHQQSIETESIPLLNSRDIRNRRNDVSRDMMHELVTTKAAKDMKGSLEQFIGSDRARSPSVTSSQQSTSSKRSFEDDGDSQRPRKRIDRNNNARNRTGIDLLPSLAHSTNLRTKLQLGLASPLTTQDGNCFSDHSDRSSDADATSGRRRSRVKPETPSRSISPEVIKGPSQHTQKNLTILRRVSSGEATVPISAARKQTSTLRA